MKQILLVLAFLPLAACASRETVPAPGTGYAETGAMTQLLDGPRVAPPANDIPESQRVAWLESHRPKAEPVPVERVVVREREPIWYERPRYAERDDWYLPLTLSFGWWGGRWGRHHGRGWGWGLGWHDRWGW